MVSEYCNTGNDIFKFGTIVKEFPKCNTTELTLALSCLADDSLLITRYYDNQLSFVILNVKAISVVEENTLIKKGYSFVKEILQLI